MIQEGRLLRRAKHKRPRQADMQRQRDAEVAGQQAVDGWPPRLLARAGEGVVDRGEQRIEGCMLWRRREPCR